MINALEQHKMFLIGQSLSKYCATSDFHNDCLRFSQVNVAKDQNTIRFNTATEDDLELRCERLHDRISCKLFIQPKFNYAGGCGGGGISPTMSIFVSKKNFDSTGVEVEITDTNVAEPETLGEVAVTDVAKKRVDVRPAEVIEEEVRAPSSCQEWEKNIPNSGPDELAVDGIEQTLDGNLILFGTDLKKDSTEQSFWLAKLNSAGDILWTKTYPEDESRDNAYALAAATDGGFVLAGTAIEDKHSFKAIRTDSEGDMAWSNTYHEIDSDSASYVNQTDDGFIILGDSYSDIPSQQLPMMLKVDSLGNELWHKKLFSETADSFHLFQGGYQEVSDGYVIAGRIDSPGKDIKKGFIAKIDSSGAIVLDKTYSYKNSQTNAFHTIVVSSGFFLMGGVTNFQDAWFVKTDVDGNEIWNKTFPELQTVTITKNHVDGSFVTGGYASIGEKQIEASWLMILNPDGDSTWNISWEGANYFMPSGTQNKNNGFIFTGNSGYVKNVCLP